MISLGKTIGSTGERVRVLFFENQRILSSGWHRKVDSLSKVDTLRGAAPARVSMVFDAEGALYITVIGEDKKGKLLKVAPGL